ncbi:MAG: hypothetical protein C4576_16275 [Desulfobacteraceae bacterium]|nr:MAG: hypothetical protein C4576_16275 [Desulfobacteraceae bacterium]
MDDFLQPPSAGELRKLAQELVSQQTTMTISTSHDDTPWAAPVYFAERRFHFYFFSDPSSRHIRETLESGKAAAAIFHQASSWKEIRGIQMSGAIRQVAPGLDGVRAVRAYLRKFPFTRDFFEPSLQIDLDSFIKKFHVRLYVFIPNLLYYQDNRIRFSFREMIRLE